MDETSRRGPARTVNEGDRVGLELAPHPSHNTPRRRIRLRRKGVRLLPTPVLPGSFRDRLGGAGIS